MPENKNDRYPFPFHSDNGDYHRDIDNMSSETDNEYNITLAKSRLVQGCL